MALVQDANWLIALSSLAAMLTGAVCQFCTASFSLQETFPRGRALHQRFVTASLEQLLLYVLNLVVMAALLPQDQLKLVPILVAIFIFGRWGSKGDPRGIFVLKLLLKGASNPRLKLHIFPPTVVLFNFGITLFLVWKTQQCLSPEIMNQQLIKRYP